MPTKGVIYCVTDSRAYLEAALISALTLRRFEPELPITIFSNLAQFDKLNLSFENISIQFISAASDNAFNSRGIKTRLINWSPYDETLFLDADILPCDAIGALWKLLDCASIAMAKDRLETVELCDHISPIEKSYTLAQVPPFSAQFNSGVMLWKNNTEVQKLAAAWQDEWQIFQKHDQLALVRALHRTKIAVATIPQTYNISPIDSLPLIQAGVKIQLLHCWGGMVAAGEFRQIAISRYPEIVEKVDDLIAS